jgi:hypothetical protein
MFLKRSCVVCGDSTWFWKSPCAECKTLFQIVQINLGRVGLSQMIDELLATGIDKGKVQRFLQNDSSDKGSILDQITAQLTNHLAEGIGVKECDMSSADVKRLRQNPQSGVSDKPLSS